MEVSFLGRVESCPAPIAEWICKPNMRTYFGYRRRSHFVTFDFVELLYGKVTCLTRNYNIAFLEKFSIKNVPDIKIRLDRID